MFKIVVLQLTVTCLVAVLVGIWLGTRGAVSALIGGMAYVLPNLLFALRLALAAARNRASAATFFVGELGKIVATMVILVAAQRYVDLHWLALLIGLFAALKANLLAFLLKT